MGRYSAFGRDAKALFLAIPFATAALTRRRRRPIMGRLFDMSEEQGNRAKP